jgi:hypothetical protein
MSTTLTNGGGWQVLGGLLLHRVFIEMGAALRWMFWGLMLQIVAAALFLSFVPLLAFKQPAPVFALALGVGMLLWIIGSFVVLRGQFKCLHLQIPPGFPGGLPGRRWIQLAYFCELGSILLRLARNWVGRGVLGLVILPLELLSLIFLLLFLRKTADVIARSDLRRWIDFVFGCLAVTVVCGLSLPILRQFQDEIGKPTTAVIGLTMLAFLACSLLGGVVGYGTVLWRMGTAAKAFGAHLLEFNPTSDPVAQST